MRTIWTGVRTYRRGYFVGVAWAYALPHFTFTAPSSVTSGMPFDFMVSAQDANGLLLPTYSGLLHFTSSDSAALLRADTNLSNGVANLSRHTDNRRLTDSHRHRYRKFRNLRLSRDLGRRPQRTTLTGVSVTFSLASVFRWPSTDWM